MHESWFLVVSLNTRPTPHTAINPRIMNINFKTLIVLSCVCMVLSCAKDENTNPEPTYQHEIPLDEAKEAYVEGMMAVKEVVQQIFFEVLQDPELNGNFAQESIDSRTDCPEITDLNPDAFPKELSFDFGSGCLTTNGTYAEGLIDVFMTDKLSATGMEMRFTPNPGFKMQGNRISFSSSNGMFTLNYRGSSSADLKKYDLDVRDLQVIDEEGYDVILNNMTDGHITFQDVNENNEEMGLIGFADDVAYIGSTNMNITNFKDENLNVTQFTPAKVDLTCNCPKSGEALITDERGREQHINFGNNFDCNGMILVDLQEVECR